MVNTTYLFSFVETPRKFIIAELSIRKLGSSSVLITPSKFLFRKSKSIKFSLNNWQITKSDLSLKLQRYCQLVFFLIINKPLICKFVLRNILNIEFLIVSRYLLQVPRMFQIVDQLSSWQSQTMMLSMETIQKGRDIFLCYLSKTDLNIRGLLVISGFVYYSKNSEYKLSRLNLRDLHFLSAFKYLTSILIITFVTQVN